MTSQLLIIIQSKEVSLEDTGYISEAIDAAMGVAAFGVSTSILFVGDCIKYVIGESRLKIIDALEFYEIEKLYLFESDIEQWFSSSVTLENPIQLLQDNQFCALLDQHKQILRMG